MTNPLTVLGLVKLAEDVLGPETARVATTFATSLSEVVEQVRKQASAPTTPTPSAEKPGQQSGATAGAGASRSGRGVWSQSTDRVTDQPAADTVTARPEAAEAPQSASAGARTRGWDLSACDVSRDHLTRTVTVTGSAGTVTGQLLEVAHSYDATTKLTVTAPASGTVTIALAADAVVTLD